MKKLLPIAVSIIASCLFVFSQTPEKLSCPSVVVSGSSGAVSPGGTANFTVEILDPNKQVTYEYLWTVSPELVFYGQGSTTIRVELRDFRTITAIVRIKGLPADCPNTASETYSIEMLPTAEKLGEISSPSFVGHKNFLENIRAILLQQPNAMLYVVLQFRRGTSAKTMNRDQSRLADQLSKSKIDLEQTRFVVTDNGNREIIFWLVPPGASKPSADK